MSDLQKVAIVTGCSSGIGLQTSIKLAENNYVVYAGLRSLSSSHNLDHLIQDKNLTNIHVIELDISKDDSVNNAVSNIIQENGQIDVLVNNAGYGVMGHIEDLSVQEFTEQFQTGFFGPLRMIKAVLPQMKKQNSGRIVNISAIVGRIGVQFASPLSCSKFALEGLSESMRYELRGTGIITTVIEPAIVKTRFNQNMKYPEKFTSEENKQLIEKIKTQAEKMVDRAGISASEVAQKILDVLGEDNPKVRYAVGDMAHALLDDKKLKTDEEFEDSFIKTFEQAMNEE